jgi:hypothetical protein
VTATFDGTRPAPHNWPPPSTRPASPQRPGRSRRRPPPRRSRAPGVDVTLTLVGRVDAGIPVDHVFRSGRWVASPRKIVLSTDVVQVPLRSTVQFPGGLGQAVADPRWVRAVGHEVRPTPGSSRSRHSLSPIPTRRRPTRCSTRSRMAIPTATCSPAGPPSPPCCPGRADRHEYVSGRPTRRIAGHAAPFGPFIVAFAVLGLATALLIITNVISGAIGTTLFQDWRLKELGATLAQVVRAFSLIALLPSAVGVLLGAVLGNVIATSLLRNAGGRLGYRNAERGRLDRRCDPRRRTRTRRTERGNPGAAGRMYLRAPRARHRTRPRSGRGRYAYRLLPGLRQREQRDVNVIQQSENRAGADLSSTHLAGSRRPSRGNPEPSATSAKHNTRSPSSARPPRLKPRSTPRPPPACTRSSPAPVHRPESGAGTHRVPERHRNPHRQLRHSRRREPVTASL